MKTIYLSRTFQPVIVSAHVPGDVYSDPYRGECRRLTAKRLCLMAERAGKESEALCGLLSAIGDVASSGLYDGMTVESWYGMVGLKKPEETAPKNGELRPGVCAKCKREYWYAVPELRTLCFDCWIGPLYVPKNISDFDS